MPFGGPWEGALMFSLPVRALIVLFTYQSVMMFSVTGTALALPVMVDDFNTSVTTVIWVMLAYSLAVAGSSLPIAQLSTLLSRRTMLVASMALDIGLMVLVFFTPYIFVVIVARFIHAAARVGPLLVLQVMGVGGFPPEQRGRVLGIMDLVMGFNTMMVIPASGFIIDQWGWRWIFLGSAVVMSLVAIAVVFVLPKDDRPTDREKPRLLSFDVPGSFLFLVGVVGVLLAVQMYTREMGVTVATLTLVGSLAALVAFVRVELRTERPIIFFPLFRNPGYLVGSSQGVIAGLLNQSPMVILPFLLITGYGWSAAYAGGILFFLSVARPLASPLAGFLSDRVGSNKVIIPAAVISMAAMISIVLQGTQPSVPVLAVSLVFLGFGQGMMMVAMQRLLFTSLPPSQMHMAPGTSMIFRTLGEHQWSGHSRRSAGHGGSLGRSDRRTGPCHSLSRHYRALVDHHCRRHRDGGSAARRLLVSPKGTGRACAYRGPFRAD